MQDRRPAAAVPPQPQISGMSTGPRAGMQCNIALCAARYGSFNAADCSYQPYGGGPRRICEAGSRSAEASPQTPAEAAPRADMKGPDVKVSDVKGSTVKGPDAKDVGSARTAEEIAKPAASLRAGAQCNLALCAAKYRSFHAADCTYQPHGGGPRSICELSGRSADATPQTPPVASAPRSDAKDMRAAEKAVEVPKPATPARAGGQCNVSLCAARYSSFHAADCTYQPLGGGPRSLCELGTRSADATPQMSHAATAPRTDTEDTLIAEKAEEVPKSAAPARAGQQCNVALCAATYRSFHAADCTYQPEAGGPREICEQ